MIHHSIINREFNDLCRALVRCDKVLIDNVEVLIRTYREGYFELVDNTTKKEYQIIGGVINSFWMVKGREGVFMLESGLKIPLQFR